MKILSRALLAMFCFFSLSAFGYNATITVHPSDGLDAFARNLIEKHVSLEAVAAAEEAVKSGVLIKFKVNFKSSTDDSVNWSPGGSKEELDPGGDKKPEKTCRIVMSRSTKGEISVHIDGKLVEGEGGGSFETKTEFDVEVPCKDAAKTIRELKESLNP